MRVHWAIGGVLLAVACGEGVRQEADGTCDPIADRGCPSGQHCELVEAGRAVCLRPAAPINAACAPGTCEPGSSCLRVGGLAACRRVCRADADCGGSGLCTLEVSGTSDIAACAEPCALAAGCGRPDAHCTVAGGLPFPICLAPGAAGEDAPCSEERCIAGLGCVQGADGQPRCRRLCAPDVPCPADLRCAGQVSGVDGVGYCIP
jgi:hypothetical protein